MYISFNYKKIKSFIMKQNLMVNESNFSIIKIVVISVLFLFVLYFNFHSILNEEITVDASYYLSLIKQINEGKVLYNDLKTIYTPFFLLSVSWIKDVLGISINYTFDLAIIFILQLLNAFLIYLLSKKIKLNLYYSLYAAVCYLIFSLAVWKLEFTLEPIVNFFGLLSLVLLNSKKTYTVFLSAFFASLAFLSKQYGIGFLFLNLVFIYLQNGKTKQFAIYFIIYFLPVIIFLNCYPEFVTNFVGTNYSNDQDKSKSFSSYILDNGNQFFIAFFYLVKLFPIVLFSIIIFLMYLKNNKITILLLGFFGFLLQFVIAPFHHYFLLALPFLSIFVFYQLKIIKNENVKIVYIIILCFSFMRIGFVSCLKTYGKGLFTRKEQLAINQKIDNAIISHNDVYIYDVQLNSHYYLSNLIPPNLDYTFGIAADDEFKRNSMKLAKTLIILDSSIKNNDSVKTYINTYYTKVEEIPIILHKQNNKVEIYSKKQ